MIFLEGKGLHRGWSILADKLYLLGIIPLVEARRMVFPTKKMINIRMVSVNESFKT